MFLNFFNNKNKDEQLRLQNEHVAAIRQGTKSKSFLGGEQFFQSMRMDGYLDEGEALCDIIDNSIEAGSSNVDIIILREDKGEKKVDKIAIVDNGHGMSRDMLESSIGFGSTSRGQKQDGLGRFGMGLSKAGIAFTEFLEVYSRPEQSDKLQSVGQFHKTFIDLRKNSETYFSDDYYNNVLKGEPPKAVQEEVPNWIEDGLGYKKMREAKTIIVLSNFTESKRKWGPKVFIKRLMDHIGVIYFKFFAEININIIDFMNNKSFKVEFIDPLFITQGLRGFDLDEDRAIELPGSSINLTDEIKDDNNKVIETRRHGEVSVRLSVMPPTFGVRTDMKNVANIKAQSSNSNARFKTMRHYTGVILIRNNRVIGVEPRKPTRFVNNDYNIGVELNFTGKADDLMGITNKKNSVSLSDAAWEMLDKQIGLGRGISSCRRELERLKPKKDTFIKTDKGNNIRPSELVASKEVTSPRKEMNPEVQQKLLEEGNKNIDHEVTRIFRETNENKDKIESDLTKDIIENKFKILEKNLLGADFVTFEQFGLQTRVIINKDHKFYEDIFSSEHLSIKAKEALSCLLMSLWRSVTLTLIENNSTGKVFYGTKAYRDFMRNWSEILGEQLIELNKTITIDESKPIFSEDTSEVIK